jgi:hypothetical protein
LTATVLLCSALASAAEVGVRAGYYGTDVKKAFGGVEVLFPFGSIAITPSIDYTRVEGVSLYFASADLQYVVRPLGGATYWLGAGPAYGYAHSGGETAHEWGWDGNAGIGWRAGGLRPYATIRYVKIKELKTTGAAIGLRFGR